MQTHTHTVCLIKSEYFNFLFAPSDTHHSCLYQELKTKKLFLLIVIVKISFYCVASSCWKPLEVPVRITEKIAYIRGPSSL